MGLQHNWRTPDKSDDASTNYMGYTNGRTQFIGGQLFFSYSFDKVDALNQGMNYMTLVNGGYYTPTTSNTKPYNNAKQGQKVPKPYR